MTEPDKTDHHTTPEHFETFRAEFLKWAKTFGLTRFRFRFVHEPDDVLDGWVSNPPGNETVTVGLSTTFSCEPTEADICEMAFHEAMETLLIPLDDAARNRTMTYDELKRARHEIIGVFENVIWQPDYDALQKETDHEPTPPTK